MIDLTAAIVALVLLSLLAFVSAGHTPDQGKYSGVVDKGEGRGVMMAMIEG